MSLHVKIKIVDHYSISRRWFVPATGSKCAMLYSVNCVIFSTLDKMSNTSWCQVAELNEQLESEKRQQLEQAQKAGQSSGGATGSRDSKDNWTDAEIQMLIKAVNLFPAGTNSRSGAFMFFNFAVFFLQIVANATSYQFEWLQVLLLQKILE